MKRMQHCFWCGAELGVFELYHRDIETCGARECEREARYQRQAEAEDARHAAEDDDYNKVSLT